MWLRSNREILAYVYERKNVVKDLHYLFIIIFTEQAALLV